MAHAADNARGSMSIVPYDNNRQILLRHADSIVIYDPASRQLVLRNANNDVDARRRLDCPTCHRPWGSEPSHADRDPEVSSSGAQPGFINHDYFRMLHQSLPASQQSSVPPSPRRRLVQPVGSVSDPLVTPPPGAEFVGSSPAPPSQAHGISSRAFTEGYFEKFFVVEKELGRGGRGVVLLVEHMLEGVSLGLFACKRVPIGDDHAWLEKVLVEVQLLQTLSHQNLVSYRHVWLEDVKLSPFSPSVPCAFILQQYCNGGDVHNYVCGPAQVSTTTQELRESMRRRSRGEAELPRKIDEPRKLQFDEIYSFFKDITSGLRFLHSSGFIHRDLKPSNCLLHSSGHETRVLVSDFGEVQYENSIRKSTGATGTISYCAPEVLRRVSPDGPYGNFTFKSDIFSLGMILYFLCFATLPYRYADVLHEEKEDLDHLRAEITQWEGFDDERKIRPDLPEKLYVFLKRLLSVHPDHRPTAEEVNNGIRTGAGLQEPPYFGRPSSSAPEELTPGRRIVRLDSPAPTTSVPGKSAQTSAVTRASHGRLYHRAVSRSPSALDTTLQPSDKRELDEEKKRNTRSPDREVVIHSPISSDEAEHHRPTPELPRRTPLLLPPPPGRRIRIPFRSLRLLRSPQTSYLLRSLLLSLKIISLLQPCADRGINQAVVYPMIALAIVDITLPGYPVYRGVLALAAHLFILGITINADTLCAPDPAWKHDE